MNRGVLTAAVVAFAGAGAGVAAYYFIGRDATQAPSPSAAEPSHSTPAVATSPAPAQLVATLPEFTLADRAGQPTSLAAWRGKSLIVNFWATWCAPCRREIPLFQQIERERGPDGFQVVGIAVDFRDKVLEYADEMKIAYPLLIGEQDALDAAAAFGIQAVGFPFTVFADREGRVIVAHMGELHADEAALILDAVAAVNAGQSTPEQARVGITSGLTALQQASAAKNPG
jgi:thiol-disulfide isomerase/thioredoxin